ncbi:MAG: lytic transglycosylase domain-containing protein [Burkholderiaceae bacterium]|nr:lytic transglycosylase domain-containing protein [Burkholderiaceae bacterium]
MFRHRQYTAFLFILLAAPFALADTPVTPEQDAAFLQLRDAAGKQDTRRAEQIAPQLSNYPIPSYVAYYRLKARLDTAEESEIRAYLSRYHGTAIADRLRNDWLLLLGKRGDWATFDQQYPLFQLKDDIQLKCYALLSRSRKGEQVASEARTLLDEQKRYGEACSTLVTALAQSGQFGSDALWEQVRLAAEKGSASHAKRIGSLAGVTSYPLARAFEIPLALLSKGPGSSRATRETFVIALGQLAKKDHKRAADILQTYEKQLNSAQQAAAWKQIALPASLIHAPQTLAYWKKARNTPLSIFAQEWRARTALLARDWNSLNTWIATMPPALQQRPAWRYWKGRALRVLGKKAESDKYFSDIAGQYHFYGLLSMEELGQTFSRPPTPAAPAGAELAQLAKNAGLRAAIHFFSLGMRPEGVREWNWQLRGMNERNLLAVAEFARQNNLLDRMISSSSRTTGEIDFAQRFPTPFKETLQSATHRLGLDLAWVYGLIRQESRFIMDARSSAGASGLMQLMPATARHVAKKIGLTAYDSSRINTMETNILLGTSYLNMTLRDLNNAELLASAAYNAGPKRPRLWRSRLQHPVEGAIFAEAIPFSETRDYVKNVMSNAVYYAVVLERGEISLKKRLGEIHPQ